MTRLRKDQTEQLLQSLETATSGPLEEVTILREALEIALRIILDRPHAPWDALINESSRTNTWNDAEREQLLSAATPENVTDLESLLWALWDLVTELSERRSFT